MKVVVTGATSFIGTAVVAQLLQQGAEVCAVVRPASSHLVALLEKVNGRNAAYHTDESPAEKPVNGVGDGINRSWKELPSGLRICELDLDRIGEIQAVCPAADAWIHIGWDGAGSENRTRREIQQRNVVYGLQAVEAAAALGCRRFLFTGSQAEYGPYHQPTTEETPCHPVSEYGKAKVDFSRQATTLCKSLGMEYVHTRIYSIYGPGDHPWSLVSTCLRDWQRGETVKLGECTQNWNFLYIEDVASALICLLTEGQAGVYNIAGTDTRPLRDYIQEMYELCGRQGGYVYGERPPNAEGPADLMPDIGKLCRETGWRPKTTFAEGIHETLYSMQSGASAEGII